MDKLSKMKAIHAVMTAALGEFAARSINRAAHNKPASINQCLECGKPHQHNNSWCSADCCRAWRARK